MSGTFTISGLSAILQKVGLPNGGTGTLMASASGYLAAERTNLLISANSQISTPSVQFRAGLVNSDTVVNINDITAVVSNFGKTSPLTWE